MSGQYRRWGAWAVAVWLRRERTVRRWLRACGQGLSLTNTSRQRQREPASELIAGTNVEQSSTWLRITYMPSPTLSPAELTSIAMSRAAAAGDRSPVLVQHSRPMPRADATRAMGGGDVVHSDAPSYVISVEGDSAVTIHRPPVLLPSTVEKENATSTSLRPLHDVLAIGKDCSRSSAAVGRESSARACAPNGLDRATRDRSGLVDRQQRRAIDGHMGRLRPPDA